MRARRSVALALTGLLAAATLVACGNGDGNTADSGSSKAATVLNIGMPNGPQTENHNPFLGSSSGASLGYRWMIFESPTGKPSVEDLAVGVNAVSGSIETAGHGERLLCAVFAFTDGSGGGGGRVYFIYNYKRGYWYPFVPARGDGKPQDEDEQQRSTERELQIKAQISSELPIEPEIERWFPLWGIPI